MGAYVDDELPDYIMVMVSNEKTQAQMASDLALFLGDDANKFASWLHRAMTKLKAMTAEKQKNNNTETSSNVSGKGVGGEEKGGGGGGGGKSGAVSRESTPPTQPQ